MPYVEASVRRERLTAAARIALAREGVANTSPRAVAAEAGVPLGTLQYVFPSKEKLLQAVIENVVEEISEVLKSSAELDRGLAHAIRDVLRTSSWRVLLSSWTCATSVGTLL